MIADYEKQYKEKLLAEAYTDFSIFCEYLDLDEPPAPHHHVMCQYLQEVAERKILRLAMTLPAGAGKSVFSSRRLAAWCLGRRKEKWLQASYAANFATNELGKKTKAIVVSDEYKNVFGDVALKADQRAGDKWALSNDSEYTAKGVGAGIMGFRATIASVDDLYASYKEAQDPKIRQEAYNWFLSDLQSRLLPKSPIILTNTRYNSSDLIGKLSEESKEGKIIPYTVLNFKALSEAGDDPEDDPMKRSEPDIPLWDFYADDYFQKKATWPSAVWSSMMQGIPIDAEGAIVKNEWFRRYDNDVRKDPNVTKRRTIISVDTAQKTGERNDWTVILVILESSTGLFYVLDCVREKVEFPEMCKLIDETAQRWSADVCVIEDRGAGTQYIQTRQGKTTLPIIPITTSNNSKEFRFDSIAPMIESGMVYLPTTANWLPAFEREIMSFPYGDHDDMVDALSQGLEWGRARQRKGGTKKLHGSGTAGSSEFKRSMVERAIQEEMERKRLEKEKSLNHVKETEEAS